MNNPLVIWILCDGKPGHENQSMGLSEALGRRLPCAVHHISLKGVTGAIRRLAYANRTSGSLPGPDMMIGAGHATHLSLLWLSRRTRARSVVLMRPSLPLGWFDWCIAPEHDFPAGFRRPNLLLTRGALNRLVPDGRERTGKVILIGGPSKTHGWDSGAMLDMLSMVTDRGGWVLTDSRRTPGGFIDEVRRHLPGVSVISHTETPPGWVPEKLSAAKEVWVTEDSVSMVYEALTSGARVGLLPVPRIKGKARVLCGLDRLVAENFLTPFDEWHDSGRIATPPEILREADRCAEALLGHLGLP